MSEVVKNMIWKKTGEPNPCQKDCFTDGFLLFYKGELIGNWETQEIY